MEPIEHIPAPLPGPAPEPAPPAPAPQPVPQPAPAFPQPSYEPGGNINQESWVKSIPWLQVGIFFLSSLALMSVIHYHRLKVRNLKSEIPAAKKRMDELESMITDLDANKVDKKQAASKQILGM